MFFSDCSVDAKARQLQKVPHSPPFLNVFGEGALFTPVVITLFSVPLLSAFISQLFAVFSRE